MNCKKTWGLLVLLIVGISVLYAANNATLKSGVYRASGIQGDSRVIFSNSQKSVTVYTIDGTISMRGSFRISGSRVNVDYGNNGFETWTIVDDETFQDDNYGYTWRWVRSYKNSEL